MLALLGAVVLLGALSKAEETHVDKFDWRIVFLVVGSVVVYGLVLKLLGVYISVFILVLISSLASHEFSLKVAVANGIFWWSSPAWRSSGAGADFPAVAVVSGYELRS